MNESEIHALLKSVESDTLEFKESFDKETVETAGAFTNTKGGLILVGVTDKGNPKGIQISAKTQKDWANQIAQSTEPRLIPEIELAKIGGKAIVLITIKESPLKPVSVKGRCIRRVGTANRIMTPQEIAELHLHSTGGSWDKFPARDAALADIDKEKVRKYMKRAIASGRCKIAENENSLEVLQKLELIKNGRPTWAAILLFRREGKDFLSQAAIHCGRFKEETLVIDDRMIRGVIIEQIEEAMDFIRKNINVRFVMTGKPAREQIWDYPLEAVREALINAVCHRDYSIPSNTEVRIHDDRLIVWSPKAEAEGSIMF